MRRGARQSQQPDKVRSLRGRRWPCVDSGAAGTRLPACLQLLQCTTQRRAPRVSWVQVPASTVLGLTLSRLKPAAATSAARAACRPRATRGLPPCGRRLLVLCRASALTMEPERRATSLDREPVPAAPDGPGQCHSAPCMAGPFPAGIALVQSACRCQVGGHRPSRQRRRGLCQQMPKSRGGETVAGGEIRRHPQARLRASDEQTSSPGCLHESLAGREL